MLRGMPPPSKTSVCFAVSLLPSLPPLLLHFRMVDNSMKKVNSEERHRGKGGQGTYIK